MKTDDYDYELDPKFIAQTPLENRSDSKLLIVNRETEELKHDHFLNVINYLNSNDVLVVNNSKVIPARLIGEKIDTKAVIELLLLHQEINDEWECLAKPIKRLKEGTLINFGNKLTAQVIKIKEEGIIVVKLIYDGILLELLDELGQMPLPPYIHEHLEDKSRYQTVYAKESGSAAAPTAGFHFTNDLIEQIKAKGIKVVSVTLHVGLGTFRPVMVDDIKEHKMHSEYYYMSEEAAKVLNETKKNGGRIISVGTTSTRVLETVMNKYRQFINCSGETDIFIYPGYKFLAVDALITNFHLPKSTLLMLVSAFSSKELIKKSYQEAIDNEYRFFSFGDAMFII